MTGPANYALSLVQAKTIYNKYFVNGATDLIPFDKDIVENLKRGTNISQTESIARPFLKNGG